MRGRTFLLTLAAAVCLSGVGHAALIVNSPQPITHRVTVQLIQTALDNGTSPATVFGDAAQRARIEAQIDAAWAQAGIDVHFLPTIVPYHDTFAYQGNLPPSQTRPTSDLTQIITNAQLEGGITHPDASVIDIFFVDIAPGWSSLPSNWVAGLGNVGTNGIAEYVGSSVSNPDSAAHWVAHEIGHNLGLFHTVTSTQNLMTANRTTAELTQAQISAIFQTEYRYDELAYIPAGGTGFPQPLSGYLDGDYNHDGRVDSADYTLWRDSIGQTGPGLVADGNGDNMVDETDYIVWQSHFGYFASSGQAGSGQAAVRLNPEPTTLVSLAAALLALGFFRRRSRRAAP